MTKKRIEWVDWVKGVCTIFVVMCHLGWPELFERILNPVFLSAFLQYLVICFRHQIALENLLQRNLKGLLFQ